jgi:hypothetical protein
LNLENTSVDKDLLLNFFLNFARFEFALKASGFTRLRGRDGVEPNWDNFINSITEVFNKDHSEELRKACDYILSNPPKRQVLSNNGIPWEDNNPRISENNTEFIIRMVKQIRNNLFHGGKYDSESAKNSERKTILLNSALTILDYCLSLNGDLKYNYNDARI